VEKGVRPAKSPPCRPYARARLGKKKERRSNGTGYCPTTYVGEPFLAIPACGREGGGGGGEGESLTKTFSSRSLVCGGGEKGRRERKRGRRKWEALAPRYRLRSPGFAREIQERGKRGGNEGRSGSRKAGPGICRRYSFDSGYVH